MALYKLHLHAASAEAAHRAAALLGDASRPAASATTVFEAQAGGYLVEAYYTAAPDPDDVAQILAGAGEGLGNPQIEAVPEENWVALSQSALPPVTIGGFTVHGSHDRERLARRHQALEIEAGEAFGTGRNPTTALCLEALWRLMRRQHRFHRVLDLGCGTGILAIAAARMLPAARVLAIDNDPVATAIAAENARLNRVAGRVRVVTGDLFRSPALRSAARFDLVLANILPGPLVDLAPRLRTIAPNAVVILSGLLNAQAREVAAVWRMAGYALLCRRSQGGWTALVVHRRGR
jgi:ribosomal protein L11 methyltransferase